jgi:glyoxylase-like metal-dependent hydrolase (beta-lactamase superfamily II)
VGTGVYAFVQGNGPYGNAGFSDAGFVVGPDYVVVIDTLGTNSMHDGFINAIRSVTALPVGLVVITHHHVDHVLGTHRFMPARVICHRHCRAHIAAERDTMVQRWRSMRPLLAHDLDDIPVVVPDITFEQRISVHLGERELVVFHPGLAHSDGDAAVYLPQDRLLFTGDLFFDRVCPAAFQGSVSGWITAVEGLLGVGADPNLSASIFGRVRRETGKEQRVQVPHSKGVANHVVPESCAGHREVHSEALTGVRAGQPLSRVRNPIRVPTPSDLRKATRTGAPSQAPARPGVVVDPGMHARSLHGNREISSLTAGASCGRRPASGR